MQQRAPRASLTLIIHLLFIAGRVFPCHCTSDSSMAPGSTPIVTPMATPPAATPAESGSGELMDSMEPALSSTLSPQTTSSSISDGLLLPDIMSSTELALLPSISPTITSTMAPSFSVEAAMTTLPLTTSAAEQSPLFTPPVQPSLTPTSPSTSIETSTTPTSSLPPFTSVEASITPTSSLLPFTSVEASITPTSSLPPFTSVEGSITATASLQDIPEATNSPSPSPSSSPSPGITSDGPGSTGSTTEVSFYGELLRLLGGPLGVAGTAVGVVLVAFLFVIVCCIFCCCTCKKIRKCRRRKNRMDYHSGHGISFKNEGARHGGNGVLGTGYQYTGEQEMKHYETIDTEGGGYHFNESAIDDNNEIQFPNGGNGGGEASQILPSQLSIPNTEIFSKSTLPELSPMTYSLTANYPFPSENSGLYINTLPTSTLSLRQPTMFGLSLQNEESKSQQGSRLSIHGSRPSIHGSRPSIHGSRPSVHESRPSIYSSRTSSIPGGLGSRHALYNSGTSESLLLGGGRLEKENSLDEDSHTRDIFTNRLSSPNLLPSNSDSMEVPTRDSSPMSRPLMMATSHPLGHGKRDFASLTCIANPSAGSLPPTPEPLEEHQDTVSALARAKSPTHKKPKRDLTSLTSVPIPEEEEKVKSKDESPSVKKPRSKTMSRLEKLTSLDYIRQSFRIKKKKVSFQKTPESTPTPSKKSSLKKQTATMNGEETNGPNTPEKQVASPQRRMSTTSSDLFSPTEDSYLRMQQQAAQGYIAALNYAQLSQPSYYLPPHHPQYPYPQLSQQYYPQLSQGYPPPGFPSPYHHMHANPYMPGMQGGGEGPGHRDLPTSRYQEVITPDFSDITSPDHERYRSHSPPPSDIQGSEYSYDLRPHSPDSYSGDDGVKYREREVSPRHNGLEAPSRPHRLHSTSPEPMPPGKYTPGGHHLGMHPQLVSPGHYHPHPHYYNQEPFHLGSPQHYSGGHGYGRGLDQDGQHSLPRRRGSGAGFSDGQPASERVSVGSMPESDFGRRTSIESSPEREVMARRRPSVDRRTSLESSPERDLGRRTSIGSTPERRLSRDGGTGYHDNHHMTSNSISVDQPLHHRQNHHDNHPGPRKQHVSWSSEVREHPES